MPRLWDRLRYEGEQQIAVLRGRPVSDPSEDRPGRGVDARTRGTTRQRVVVEGTVTSLGSRVPGESRPGMIMELETGTRTVALVWLGRRGVGGVEVGTRLRAAGVLTSIRGRETIFHPTYELLVPSAEVS